MEGGEAGVVAVTKVFAIRVRLDDRVRYITDGEKTSLASSITYISNPEKTEQFFFTSALNCSSVDTALSEMMETKQQFGKMGGVLGYHFIQSFQPGEVTPEQAHAVGLEFAKRLFGKRYEVVISTHLNKHHLHNHLVVNSVSCIDGQKYHSSPESYYNDVRGTSDALCRENDLSVIAPQGKGKHYAEWKAEQGGKPTVRGIIRADIDTIIGQAYDPKTQSITVSSRLIDSKIFAALSREIVHAGIHDHGRYPYYTREDCAMDAESVSYMLCRNFGVETPQPDVSRVGQVFDGMEVQDRRGVVDSLQKYFRKLQNDIQREISPQERKQPEQNRPVR